MKSRKELTEERSKLATDLNAIHELAKREERDLTAEEGERFNNLAAEIDKVDAELNKAKAEEAKASREEQLAKINAKNAEPTPRQTATYSTAAKLNKMADAGGVTSYKLSRGNAYWDGELRMDKLMAGESRAAQSLRQRGTPEYQTAFNSYLMGERRDYESLGLIVGDDSKGGYTVPVAMAAGMLKFLDDEVTMRRLGTVLPPTTAKSVGVLSFDTDYADADWTPEVSASDISEDAAARFGNREMTPHGLAKLIKASAKMVRSSSMSVESFVQGRANYRFALTENKAFLTGSGSQRPLGVFTASNDGIPTSRDVTCVGTTAFTIDDLIGCVGDLKESYRRRATWLFHRDFMTRLRKLKDGMAQYYFGINGQPDTLLNIPVVLDENAPSTFTTGQYIAMLGDFSFYWIQDSLNMEVQRLDELFALTGHVGWVFRKETDGMPVLSEAFRRLKLA